MLTKHGRSPLRFSLSSRREVKDPLHQSLYGWSLHCLLEHLGWLSDGNLIMRGARSVERVLCGLVEKSKYKRTGPTRHDTPPLRFKRADISATTGSIDKRSF